MANSPDSSKPTPAASDAPKRGLFSRKPKAANVKKPSRLKQINEVFQMTRRHDPMVVWLMLLSFLGVVAVSFLVGFLLENWITGLIIGIPLGLLAATLILSRRAERAAFAQIENQPGASGAALGTLKRGWITEDQPVAVNPRTQDAVFRAIGRPGVVLVSEGPSHRVRPLVDAERKRLARILPNVTVHVIESGRGEGQVPLSQVAKKMNKLNKELTKIEVSAVSKRISSLGKRLPFPLGIDPDKARPARKAARGRLY
jgi:F0F1-type ATP synthase assembly protein I